MLIYKIEATVSTKEKLPHTEEKQRIGFSV